MKHLPVFVFAECFLQLIDYKRDLSLDEYFQTCDELVLLDANGSHHMGPFKKLRWSTE